MEVGRPLSVVRRLPFLAFFLYIAATMAFFFWGPFDWQIDNRGQLMLFLACALLAMALSAELGIEGAPRGTGLVHWRAIIVVGAVANVLVLFPSAYFYTSRMPWHVFAALCDQNAAYQGFQARLLETAGARGPISLLRTLTYPFVFAVIPLAAAHWQKLLPWEKLLVVASIVSTLVFSVLRGTDREVADLVIVGGGAILAALAGLALGPGRWRAVLTWRVGILAAVSVAFVVVGANVFFDRKLHRYSPTAADTGLFTWLCGSESPAEKRAAPALPQQARRTPPPPVMAPPKICLGERAICNSALPASKSAEARRNFGVGMVAAYVAQGYYGLSLALRHDFRSTYGIGHSIALERAFTQLTGSRLYQRSYTFRLRQDGWSDEHQWSTIFPWIANDVGFPATIVVMAGLAWIWGSSWKDAVFGRNDRAVIVFCFFSQLFAYLPANNQLGQGLDSYLAVVIWTLAWLVDRYRTRNTRDITTIP